MDTNRSTVTLPLLVAGILVGVVLLFAHWLTQGPPSGFLPVVGVPIPSIPDIPIVDNAIVALQPQIAFLAQIQSLPIGLKIVLCLAIVVFALACALVPFFVFDLGKSTVEAFVDEEPAPTE